MPTHLVTGGAGFIGSHLAASLIERGDDVVVLDNLDGGKTENVPDGATLLVGSVADQATVAELFASYRFDGVYHLAAFAAEGISHAVKRHNYSVNLLGSINLINASLAAKVRFFGFASSVAVYGHGHVPMREDERPVPADSYGNAKLAVERELAVTMKLQGLPYFALRMHNPFRIVRPDDTIVDAIRLPFKMRLFNGKNDVLAVIGMNPLQERFIVQRHHPENMIYLGRP